MLKTLRIGHFRVFVLTSPYYLTHVLELYIVFRFDGRCGHFLALVVNLLERMFKFSGEVLVEEDFAVVGLVWNFPLVVDH